MVITAQQLIKNQKNKIKEKPSKNITFLLESKLIEYGIDRTKYHGGDLEGTSIVRMFQNANEIFNQFKISISKTIIEDTQIKEVNDYSNFYQHLCLLKLQLVVDM